MTLGTYVLKCLCVFQDFRKVRGGTAKINQSTKNLNVCTGVNALLEIDGSKLLTAAHLYMTVHCLPVLWQSLGSSGSSCLTI